MSWLNSSLSNIKGQITNFANEVLSEGAEGDQNVNDELEEANKKLLELQIIISNQNSEIANLRKQNAEILRKDHRTNVGAGTSGAQNVRNMEDSWFWTEDDVEADETSSQEEKKRRSPSAEMKNRIIELEQENQALSSSLEELDTQHNIASQKLLQIKSELQRKYDNLMEELRIAKSSSTESLEIVHLKEENNRLKIDFDKVQEDLAILQDENLELQQITQNMKESGTSNDCKKLLEELQNIKEKQEELIQENERLKIDIDKVDEDRNVLQDQNFELQSEIETLKKNSASSSDDASVVEGLKAENLKLKSVNDDLAKLKIEFEALKIKEAELKHENERLKVDFNKVDEGRSILQDENFELQEEIEMLKNSACSSESIESLESLKKENSGLKKEIEHYISSLKDLETLKKKEADLLFENERLKVDNDKIDEDRSILQDANIELQEQIESMKSTISSTSEISSTLEAIRKENIELKSEIDKFSNMKSELETLKENEATLKHEIERLKIDFDKVDEDRAVLQDENFELQQQIQTLKDNTSLSEANSALIESLKKENSELKTEIENNSKLKLEIETLTKRQADLVFENDRLKIDFDKVDEDKSILQDNNFELQGEIENMRSSSLAMAGTLETLRTENASLRAGLEKSSELQKEVNILREKQADLEHENNRLKIDYDKIDEDRNVLQDANFELQEEIRTLKSKESSSEGSTVESLKKENTNLKAEIENNSGLKVIIQGLEKDVCDLRNQNVQYKGENSSLKNLTDTLKQKMVSSSNDDSDNNIKIKSEEVERYERMKIDYEKVQEDLSILQDDNFEIQQKLHECSDKTELETLRNQIHILKNERDKSLTELNNLKNDLNALQNENLKLLDGSNKAQGNELLTELQEKNNTLQAEKQALSLELQHYEQECNDLMKNNDKLFIELEEMKSSKLETIAEKNEESFLNLEQQLEDCSSLNQSLEDQYKSLEQQLKQTENEKTSLIEKLKNIEKDLQEAKQSLKQLQQNLESVDQEKSNLLFELNEFKSNQNVSSSSQNKLEQESVQNIEAHNKQISEALQSIQIERDNLLQENGFLKQELQRAIKNLEERNPKVQILDSTSGQIQHLNDSESTRLKNKLHEYTSQLQNAKAIEITLRHQIDELKHESHNNLEMHRSQFLDIQAQYELLLNENENMRKRLQESDSQSELSKQKNELENAYGALLKEKNELIKLITTKHEENITYHSEIQRLTALLQAEIANKGKQVGDPAEMEKLADQVGFLREKCDILTNSLVTEQTNVKLLNQEKREAEDRAATSIRELERLRQHLVEVENSHTQEIMELDMRNNELQTKISNIEEHAIYNNTAYTSASIRANQQAETLQVQLNLMSQQRDEMLVKMSDTEDKYNKQIAALTNLQCALEQFQRDKEQDIQNCTERLRNQLEREHAEQTTLRNEITSLRTQLAEQQQGLMAAGRLAGQLETSQSIVQALKQDLKQSQDKYAALQSKMESAQSNQADKIEKSLVKNLMLGYITAGQQNDKAQILKIISAVLDFNQSECDRIGLNSGQKSSWFGGSLLRLGEEGLAKAFVEFLEKESLPRSKDSSGLSLLQIPHDTPVRKPSEPGQGDGPPATTSPAPGGNALLSQATSSHSDNMLPTFAPPRSASSILKDILKDNNT